MTSAPDLPDWVTAVGATSAKLFQSFVSGGSGNTIPVGQYGSVQVLLGNLDGTSNLVVQYQFVDPASGFTVDTGLLSADARHDVAGDGFPVWELPVRAGNLVLINGTGGSPTAVVVGRPETRRKGMAGAYYPRRLFDVIVPASTASGTQIELPGTDSNNLTPVLRDCSGYNGLVTVLVSSTQAITGQVRCMFRDKSGARVATAIANNPTTTTQAISVGHPFGFVTWQFLTQAVSPASNTSVFVNVMPSETDG